ncbi:hypothetical protein Taro_049267 [Colocasia esculenta]|uniref:Uncharacterized protein n=1 Tax=Colocasia esculenta TaxID=4460 RepID=A0A843XAF9_COLES|nr:hypothetical protein [Colocasia esculenta]
MTFAQVVRQSPATQGKISSNSISGGSNSHRRISRPSRKGGVRICLPNVRERSTSPLRPIDVTNIPESPTLDMRMKALCERAKAENIFMPDYRFDQEMSEIESDEDNMERCFDGCLQDKRYIRQRLTQPAAINVILSAADISARRLREALRLARGSAGLGEAAPAAVTRARLAADGAFPGSPGPRRLRRCFSCMSIRSIQEAGIIYSHEEVQKLSTVQDKMPLQSTVQYHEEREFQIPLYIPYIESINSRFEDLQT